MGVFIDGIAFETELGKRLPKMRFGYHPPEGMEMIWNGIPPISFGEAMALCPNSIKRRVAFSCFGVERLLIESSPVLMDTQMVKIRPASWTCYRLPIWKN